MKVLFTILFGSIAIMFWILLEKNRQENERAMSENILRVNVAKTGGIFFFMVFAIVCFVGLLCQLIRDL